MSSSADILRALWERPRTKDELALMFPGELSTAINLGKLRAAGWARYIPSSDSWEITDKGREVLNG